MAALVYFRKTAEDAETVTYDIGPDEDAPTGSLTIVKALLRPADGTRMTLGTSVATTGICRGYRKLGYWPERGYGAA